MKKTLFTFLCLLPSLLFAQTDITTFLGIPVTGTKSEMLKKLQAKGYKLCSDQQGEYYVEGEYNGIDVDIHIATNNNQVYRLMITDKHGCSETNIKIRFNRLCAQFAKNKRYTHFEDQTISADEDISLGLVTGKRYEAIFYQTPLEIDSAAIGQLIYDDMILKYGSVDNFPSREQCQAEAKSLALDHLVELFSKKPVWFYIGELLGEYYIIMYYDNEYNHADGEDL